MKCALGIAVFGAALLAMDTTPPAKAKNTKTGPTKASATVSNNDSAHPGGRSRTRKKYARRAAAPSYQLHPDAERYQQIQQALAERGYFKGEANGQWNDDSVDALKRFQADRKIEDDGKINALTLIGLGLGPKHDGSTARSVPSSPPVDAAVPASDGAVDRAAPPR